MRLYGFPSPHYLVSQFNAVNKYKNNMHKLPLKLSKNVIDATTAYLYFLLQKFECNDITDYINAMNMRAFFKKLLNKKNNIAYKNSRQEFTISFDLNECIAFIYFINKFDTTISNAPYESVILQTMKNNIVKQLTYMMDMAHRQQQQDYKLLAA